MKAEIYVNVLVMGNDRFEGCSGVHLVLEEDDLELLYELELIDFSEIVNEAIAAYRIKNDQIPSNI
jgi:hypothetical protein